MRTLPLTLVLALALPSVGLRTAAQAQPARNASATPRVVFNGVPLPVPSPDRAPYRDSADDVVCIAPESLEMLGITHQIGTRGTIFLTGPDGAPIAALMGRSGPTVGGVFIAADAAMAALGGSSQWDPARGVLTLRSVFAEAAVVDDQLQMKATLRLPTPRLSTDNAGRLVIADFTGVDAGALLKDLTVPGGGNILKARIGSPEPNTARVVLELRRAVRYRAQTSPTGTGVLLAPDNTTPAAPTIPAPRIAVATSPAPKGAAAQISEIQLRTDSRSDDRARLSIQTSKATPVRASLSGGRLALEFANATMAQKVIAGIGDISHPLLQAARVLPGSDRTTRLVLDLTRAAALFSLRMNPRGGFTLDIAAPPSENLPLAGKLIVVDPGHGGSSTGTRGVDGRLEKANTLPMALMLADALQAQGANVVMTRDCDADPGLHERAYIANRTAADFFVSIHCNDGVRNRAANGSIVYYHMSVPESREFARTLAGSLAEVGDIRNIGAHSDSTIYKNDGFAVLRCSQMVGVLVEAGFMSNTRDCTNLASPTTQRKIASALAKGIVEYVRAHSDQDTRLVNPQRGSVVPMPEPTETDDSDSDTPSLLIPARSSGQEPPRP
jgi:N-acetylmuramoyl-L-alanine amidase